MTGEKRTIFALALVAAVLAAMNGAAFLAQDREGPQIFFPENEPVYTASTAENRLLEQVTAEDQRDGTVTDSLRIEEILPAEDGHRVAVIYAAMDDSGNVTKAVRTLEVERE